jgi:hypothetical protein
MASAIDVAGDITAAATALAGLLLVFLGVVTSGFESYSADAKDAVLAKFRRRGWLAFGGFVFALLSAAFSLAGKWTSQPCLVVIAIICLASSFVVATMAALLNMTDIR